MRYDLLLIWLGANALNFESEWEINGLHLRHVHLPEPGV
jgi:hypothetical protein